MKNDELTSEKKTAIKEFLKITGATKTAEITMNLLMEQIIEILKEPEDTVEPGTFETDGTFDIMAKEAKALMHEEIVIKESLHALMYPLYHKYLTLEEINGLIRFYKTPLGRKLISVNPKIIEEQMKIGQVWGEKLNLKLQKRISKVLEKENQNVKENNKRNLL